MRLVQSLLLVVFTDQSGHIQVRLIAHVVFSIIVALSTAQDAPNGRYAADLVISLLATVLVTHLD